MLTFPEIPDLESKKMRFVKQILFAAILVIGFSLAASAQDSREKKERPPKEKNEIKPKEKPPKNDNNQNNQNNNKGKKPQAFFLISENRIEISSK